MKKRKLISLVKKTKIKGKTNFQKKYFNPIQHIFPFANLVKSLPRQQLKDKCKHTKQRNKDLQKLVNNSKAFIKAYGNLNKLSPIIFDLKNEVYPLI